MGGIVYLCLLWGVGREWGCCVGVRGNLCVFDCVFTGDCSVSLRVCCVLTTNVYNGCSASTVHVGLYVCEVAM